MRRYTLRDESKDPVLVASICTMDDSDKPTIEVTTWKDRGAIRKKTTRYPPGSYDALDGKMEELIEGFVKKGYELAPDPQVQESWRFIRMVFEPQDVSRVMERLRDAGLAAPDPLSSTPQLIEGTQFRMRVSGQTEVKLHYAQPMRSGEDASPDDFTYHVAVASLLAEFGSLSVLEGKADLTDVRQAVLAQGVDKLEAGLVETLYDFEVLKRPLDLQRDFADHMKGPFAVGF